MRNSRIKIVLLVAGVAAVLVALVVFYVQYIRPVMIRNEYATMAHRAEQAYRQYAATHSAEDLSRGPCIAENLVSGWVADIVHNPRQAIDDLPQNQCTNYLNGTATHFVELDPQGNVIRIH
jgi:hypothetical protein